MMGYMNEETDMEKILSAKEAIIEKLYVRLEKSRNLFRLFSATSENAYDRGYRTGVYEEILFLEHFLDSIEKDNNQ
jgi:hypothetical protein